MQELKKIADDLEYELQYSADYNAADFYGFVSRLRALATPERLGCGETCVRYVTQLTHHDKHCPDTATGRGVV